MHINIYTKPIADDLPFVERQEAIRIQNIETITALRNLADYMDDRAHEEFESHVLIDDHQHLLGNVEWHNEGT